MLLCVCSVILLLALHLCLFTMIGMLLFAKTEVSFHSGDAAGKCEAQSFSDYSTRSGAAAGSRALQTGNGSIQIVTGKHREGRIFYSLSFRKHCCCFRRFRYTEANRWCLSGVQASKQQTPLLWTNITVTVKTELHPFYSPVSEHVSNSN